MIAALLSGLLVAAIVVAPAVITEWRIRRG